MSDAWRGSACFSERYFVYAGPAGVTELHAHHAVQVVICRDGVELTLADRSRDEVSASAFVVPADAPHAITRAAPETLLLYVDPESDAGQSLEALVEVSTAEGWRAAATELSRVVSSGHAGTPRQLAEEILASHACVASSRDLHGAVDAALDFLPVAVGEGDVRVSDVARRVGLSESRLMHLFREQVGVPLRPYVRWLRLRLAADHVRRGASLTEASHAAGFADSAHFSNAFRDAFGVTPSDVFRNVAWEVEIAGSFKRR